MARIAGVNIPTAKRVPIALTYITGIGPNIAENICAALNIDRARRINQLSDSEVLAIREYIDANLKVEGDLRQIDGMADMPTVAEAIASVLDKA